MVPLVRSPHECPPAVTAEYCPSGAVACPSRLLPQQVMVPLVRSPHECLPAGGDGGVLPGGRGRLAGGLGGCLGCCEGEGGAGEPAAGGGGGGEEADAGQPAVAPGVVGLALLEAELDAAVVEFARHDAHRADRQVKRGTGEPVAGGGGGGEEADGGQPAVAPVLSVWRCWRPNSMRPLSSLRATMRTAALSLSVSPPGRRQRWRRRRRRGRRAGRRSPRRRGACQPGGSCRRRAHSSRRVVLSWRVVTSRRAPVLSWRAPVLIGHCPSTSRAGAVRQTLHTCRTLPICQTSPICLGVR